MASQRQEALQQKLEQELQRNEQIVWSAYPDITRRATHASIHSLFPSWVVLRMIILGGMLLILLYTSVIYHTSFLLSELYGAILLLIVLYRIVLVVQRRRVARRRLGSTFYAITT